MMKKALFMLAMLTCILAGCSGGGNDEPINPTPKPEEVKAEITLDSSIVSNGLSFGVASGEQIVSFSANTNWTLSVASTTSGATWCKASATSGSKGNATVKFTIDENTSYDDRSLSVTIKAGTASKTFTITQKGADALLVTTNKYEVTQEGGKIEVEVKANINYELAISETAKDWITESKSRALTTHKHTFEIALNEESEKREGEITFKSGDKVETVKVYQAGGAIILLSQNEFTVSDAGETISVDIKSNVEYGVQMPDVDWITNEASSRGMSSHTLKYVISPNEGYDARSAEIIFYDKNSELKDTLKVIQAQKDAIVISQKNISVDKEGGTVEVKVNTNVDFEVQIPTEVTWITQTESRTLTEKSIFLKIEENTSDKSRSVNITITNEDSQLCDTITLKQHGNTHVIELEKAGTLKKILGDDYKFVTSLKIIGSINGDDLFWLREMIQKIRLVTLDLSQSSIVEGGGWYCNFVSGVKRYTSNNIIGDYMFYQCEKLQSIILPNNIISIGVCAFWGCKSLATIKIPDSVASISNGAFENCESLTSINIPDKITSIRGSVFSGCTSLTQIKIPENTTSIGGGAFSGCKSLVKINIPNGVTIIDSAVFRDCESLKSITIPNEVTAIASAAFESCKSLASINIPDGVSVIGEDAFLRCESLTSITIPSSVTNISFLAFYGCKSLETCYCYATEPPYLSLYRNYYSDEPERYPFHGIKKGAILYVPMECRSKYLSSNWKVDFSNIIEMN